MTIKNMIVGNSQAQGVLVGNGSAINVQIGWIPDFIAIHNVTDGIRIWEGYLGQLGRRMTFTNGGTIEVLPGDKLVSNVGVGSSAIISAVVLTGGTWAGGNAAGSFLFSVINETGSIAAGTVSLVRNGAVLSSNAATVTAPIEDTMDIDTEVASATGNASVRSYRGTGGTTPEAQGFTIGSTISAAGKVLRWHAWRVV
jgi:hypothetical protein